MAVTAMILAPGETLGGYRIGEVIGVGGMAIVYRAEQLSLGREVALKVLSPTLSEDGGFRERFRREARNIAALDHPNIVAVHDFGEADGRLFLAMRLVNGTTLAERMGAAGLTGTQTLAILGPIAAALDAAHAAQLVHRDVKPQNILIGPNGHPYLADFGVAKELVAPSATLTGGFLGTVQYAAPEQILRSAIGPAVDIYALTAVLFQSLSGQAPYERDTDAAVVYAHVYEPPPCVVADTPEDESFNALIATGMAKDPGDRFAHAVELIDAASLILDGLPPARGQRPTPFATSISSVAADTPAGPEPDAPALREPSTVGLPETRPAGVAVSASMTPRPSKTTRVGFQRRRWLDAAAIAAVLTFLVLVLVPTTGGPPSNRAAHTVALGAPFTLSYTHPWRAISDAAGSRRDQRGASPAAALRGRPLRLVYGAATLDAGQLASSSPLPAGVPPALRSRYGRPTSGPAMVAGHPGRMYTWSQSGERTTAYVLGTASGDAAIICRTPVAATATLVSCRQLAQNARVSAARILPPGPDRGLARAVTAALAPVRALRSGLHRLPQATLTARAAPANGLAVAESRAAQRMRHLVAPVRDLTIIRRFAAALQAEGQAFAALAATATANDASGYPQQAERVTAAGRRLSSDAARLWAAGLGAPHLAAVHLDAPPATTNTTGTAGTATSPSNSASRGIDPSIVSTPSTPQTTTVPDAGAYHGPRVGRGPAPGTHG
jgi:hypothetical protein